MYKLRFSSFINKWVVYNTETNIGHSFYKWYREAKPICDHLNAVINRGISYE